MAAVARYPTLFGLLLLVSHCGGEATIAGNELVAGRPEEVYSSAERQRKAKKDDPDYGQTINFGVTPWGEPEKVRLAYQPLTDYLSEQLQVRIRPMIVQQYSELLADLRRGVIGIASFAPGAYADALDGGIDRQSTYVASAQMTGRKFYHGVIITGRAVRSLDALRGKTFAFVEEGSSSGYRFPLALLLGRGIDPYKFFSRVYFLGSHPKVVEAVIGGKVDAGATWDGYLEENFPNQKPPVHILLRTDPIPYDAVVVGKKYGPLFARKLQRLLVGLKDSTKTSDGRPVVSREAGFPYSGYVVNSIRTYDVVRRTSKIARAYRRPGTTAQ